MRLGMVVDHVRGSAPVHADCDKDVLADLLLHRRNFYMGKATKSRRRKSTAQLRQQSTERCPSRAPTSMAMVDRCEENAMHYLTGGR